jgi:UDP-N-acetylmuramoylalanine--D-glutamate ligase
VVNADDPEVMRLLPEQLAATSFSLKSDFSQGYGLALQGDVPSLARNDQPLLPVGQMLIPGRHNWANALAAWAMAEALGIGDSAVKEALCTFPGLRHRTQLVAEQDGVRWYNDSKGTNLGATIAALEGLAGPGADGARVVLIAGGDCKGADFTELAPVVEHTTRAVILIGRDAPMLSSVLEGRAKLLPARDLRQAVRLARQSARPGDAVLLSPACASFDMFNNYMHRGDVFIEAVAEVLK